MNQSEQLRELLANLRKIEGGASDFIGDPNPICCTVYLRNPEGPEAADAISSLLDRITELEEGVGKAAKIFRQYEALHRAKISDVCLPADVQLILYKVNRNAAFAAELESLLSTQTGEG